MTTVLKRMLMLAACVVYPLAAVSMFFYGNWYSFFHSYSLAMFFGLTSYCYFSLSLVLSARWKPLDRLFGHDRLIVYHAIISTIALVCGVLHAVLKFVYFPEPTFQSILGVAGLGIFLSVILITVILMLTTPVDRIWPFSLLLAWAKKRIHIDYTRLKTFHNLTAPAFVLIIIHVILAYPVQETAGRTAAVGISGLAAVLFYVYHKLVRPLVNYLVDYRVTEVTHLSPNILHIELSGRKNTQFKHRGGQFAFFRFLDPACGFGEHPFTISSPPAANHLTITVKNLGDYTSRLGNLKLNTRCLIDGPYGLFYPKNDSSNLLFIAGGIGITPFLSILGELLDSSKATPRNISVLWSVRQREEIFALDYLESLSGHLQGYQLSIFLTGQTALDGGFTPTRIDYSRLKEEVDRFASPEDIKAFVCGPENFNKAMQQYLKQAGVAQKNIKIESFSF